MTYAYRFSAVVEITAENAAQAAMLAKRVRLVGAATGARRPPKNRDSIAYSIKVTAARIRALAGSTLEPGKPEGT